MRKLFFIALVFLTFTSFPTHSQQTLSQSKEENLFQAGVTFLAHQELGAAHRAFSDFLSAAPSDAPRRRDAEYFVAYCAVNLYHADGERRMEQFIRTNPGHPRSATAHYDVASFFYQQKNYGKSATHFAKASFPSLTIDQQNTGRFRWGYSLFNQRKLAEALDQFNFIKAQGGQYGPASSYYAGFIEFNNGDYVNALIDLRRAETNSSYSTIVPLMIAQVLYKQETYDELLTYIKTLEAREGISQTEEIALLAAEVYFRKGDHSNAVEGYNKYLAGRENPDKSVVYRAGYSAMMAGDEAGAINLLKGVASATDSVGAYASYYLGSLYLKTNEKPKATTAFDVARQFIKDKGLVEEGSFQYAKLTYDQGRSDEAIRELEKFQVAFPESSRIGEVKEILSHAYVNANNYNKAIEYIESLPRRGPSVDRAYQKATYLKGAELFNMERYPDAIQYFEKSLQFPLDPAVTAESHYWCAEAYSIGRKYESATEHYAAIVSPSSGVTPALINLSRYGLGYAYYNLKQYDRALFNFKEFAAKVPKGSHNLADGQLRLADCYYATKAYPEALTAYRSVLNTSSPDKDYVHLQLGAILGIQRKYTEAGGELDQVVKNFPQSSHREEALFRKAQLEFEQGKYSSAVEGYTRVIQTNKASRFVPYAYMRRAASYYNLKDFGQTANDYIVVVENYPTHPAVNEALVPLQEALSLAGRAGDFDRYLAVFKAANPDAKGIESVEFETAKNLYFNQEYQKAIQRLGAYSAAYPESPRLSEAKYYQAEAYYRIKDYSSSLKGHQEISGDDAFAMINKVVARIAELEYKEARYDKAVASFRRLEMISANKKEQYTAWSGLMESFYLLAQYDSAEKYARIILEKGNINAGATNKASLFLGKTAMSRGDYETAMDEFLNTLNTARDEYGAEAKYLMGEILYLKGEHRQSNETLLSLNTDFAAYTDWVGKAWLLLAENYIAMGELFQAKGTLKSLVDHFPLQEVRDRAQEKLKVLEEDEVKRQEQLKSDTVEDK